MVILNTDSPPRTKTELYREMLFQEAKWLDEFLSRKKSSGKMPQFIQNASWPGEKEFNAHLNTYRGLQLSLWGESPTDPSARSTAMPMQIIPWSEVDLEGFHNGLKLLLGRDEGTALACAA